MTGPGATAVATATAASTPDASGRVTVLDDVGPARTRAGHRGAAATAALLVAAGGFVGPLVLWPVVRTVHASVTEPGEGFVGWRHFRTTWDAGADDVAVQTVAWAVLVPLAVTAAGLLLAYLHRHRLPRHRRMLTSVLISPIALPLVVTGVAFRVLYDPDPQRGTATRVATWLPGDVVPAWLGPRWITLALMSAFVWAWVGLAFVVFRAALDQLPRELADAVGGYGGTRWEVLRDGRWLPQLRRIVAVVLALVALSTVRTFDLILAMAPGSVIDEASVLAVLQWETSGATTSGPAAALGVFWLAAVAAGVLLVALWSRPPRWRSGRARDGRDGRERWGRRDRRDRRAASVVPAPSPVRAAAASGETRGRRVLGRAGAIVAAAALAAWMVPLLVLVATSLHAPREAATGGWWSPPFGLGSYGRLHIAGILGSLQLTAILAVAVALIVLVVALLAVRGLADMPPAGAQVLVVLFLAAAVVPVQVVAGPITEVLDWAGLSGELSRLRLGLVHTALWVPLAVVVLWNARAQPSLAGLRAAWGAEPYVSRRARLRAVLDAEPAVVVVFVLVFVQVWNDFVVGLLFGGPNAVPLGLRLYGETRQFVANAGVLAAGSIVGSVVPLLIVVLNHRRVVAGLVGTRH
ncbi:MAG: ABC transporter permease subunit [Acidimicrobiales bacterium]